MENAQLESDPNGFDRKKALQELKAQFKEKNTFGNIRKLYQNLFKDKSISDEDLQAKVEDMNADYLTDYDRTAAIKEGNVRARTYLTKFRELTRDTCSDEEF